MFGSGSVWLEGREEEEGGRRRSLVQVWFMSGSGSVWLEGGGSLVCLLSLSTWPYFDTNTLPEAESLGIYSFFAMYRLSSTPALDGRSGTKK